MAKPVIFSVKEKPTQTEAIKFVGGQVKMHDVFFQQDGVFYPLNRRALMKNGKLSEIVSASYALVKHDDVLSRALKSIRSHDKELRSVGLDSDGDRMIAQIEIKKDYEIAPGETIRPELLILNSYDHSFSAGFDLAFTWSKTDAVTLTDYSCRWNHFGSAPGNIDFKEVDGALDYFEKEVLPALKRLNRVINKDTAIKIVVASEIEKVLPRKTARRLCEIIDANAPKTLLELFKTVSDEVTHSMNISPSYRRQLWKEVGHFFLEDNPTAYAGQIKLKDVESLISTKRGPREKKEAQS